MCVRSLADDAEHTRAVIDRFGVKAVASLLSSQDVDVAAAALKSVLHFARRWGAWHYPATRLQQQ